MQVGYIGHPTGIPDMPTSRILDFESMVMRRGVPACARKTEAFGRIITMAQKRNLEEERKPIQRHGDAELLLSEATQLLSVFWGRKRKEMNSDHRAYRGDNKWCTRSIRQCRRTTVRTGRPDIPPNECALGACTYSSMCMLPPERQQIGDMKTQL